jgi:hypothetical protein
VGEFAADQNLAAVLRDVPAKSGVGCAEDNDLVYTSLLMRQVSITTRAWPAQPQIGPPPSGDLIIPQ